MRGNIILGVFVCGMRGNSEESVLKMLSYSGGRIDPWGGWCDIIDCLFLVIV